MGLTCRLALVFIVVGAFGCKPDCPASLADATLCHADFEQNDLDYDWNRDGAVGLDDVVLAEQAFEACRLP